MSEYDRLIQSYPRVRPPLSPAHRRIYEAEYLLNRKGLAPVEGLAKTLESWMHRRVARIQGGPVLEVGAGTLNHLPFETALHEYDIVEPFTSLYADSPQCSRVRDAFHGIADVPQDRRYYRIVSIAALEHMENLPHEIAHSCLLLEPHGVFQAGIPSEGGFLWGLAWRATTGLAYRLRNRLDFGTVVRHEHLSTATEILCLVRMFFGTVKLWRFPTPFHHLSFYTYIEARRPNVEYARSLLER